MKLWGGPIVPGCRATPDPSLLLTGHGADPSPAAVPPLPPKEQTWPLSLLVSIAQKARLQQVCVTRGKPCTPATAVHPGAVGSEGSWTTAQVLAGNRCPRRRGSGRCEDGLWEKPRRGEGSRASTEGQSRAPH